MDSISSTAIRAHLARIMDQVRERHEPVIITRQGKEPVVMMSLSDFKSLEATAGLLSHLRNAKRLLATIADPDRE